MPNNLKIALMIIVTLILAGTMGFHFIEGWNVLESFYTTVMTLTTIGYGDFAPKTHGGMLFTVLLVIFGVGTMLYTVGLVAQIMVEGRLTTLLGRGKMEKTIDKMKNHYIVCGCGRIGYLICRELAAEKVDFVVIDNNPEVIQKIREEGFVYFRGDATHDKCLIGAGIMRARGIVCVLPSDAQNLYVILTAKELNPDIWILSRSEEEDSEHRLARAGADRVMSPYTLGGNRDGHGHPSARHAGFHRDHHPTAEPGAADGRAGNLRRLAAHREIPRGIGDPAALWAHHCGGEEGIRQDDFQPRGELRHPERGQADRPGGRGQRL